MEAALVLFEIYFNPGSPQFFYILNRFIIKRLNGWPVLGRQTKTRSLLPSSRSICFSSTQVLRPRHLPFDLAFRLLLF